MVTPGKTTVATAECDPSQGPKLIYMDSQYEQGPTMFEFESGCDWQGGVIWLGPLGR